jgi:flagellar hook-associated protein 2
MANIGLNFGSATSGAGFDVTSTVTQIVTNLQSIEAPWKTRITALQAQDTALSSLGTQLSTLTTDLQNLTDFNGVLAGKQGSSSNTSLLQLTTAGTNAIAGTHAIRVNSLAQTSTAATDAVSATDTLAGGITFKVGAGTWLTVNVGDGSTAATLAGLAQAINSAGVGVTANVLTNADGTARLSLVSQTNGAAGQITIADSTANPESPTTLADTTTADMNTGLGLKTIQDGLDASMVVDGVQMTSASNTVSNAVPGVTFQLLSAQPSASVQVVITNDISSVSTAVGTLVSDYNAVIKAINTQEGKDSSGNPEPLYASTVLAQLQQSLQSGLNLIAGSGAVTSLSSLGITANQDGSISLNTDTLTSVLNSNYSDVISFFQDTGKFGSTFASTLNNLGSNSTMGAITLALRENKSQEKSLNDNVSNEEALIAIKKAQLTAELNAANQILQAIPSQINQINEMYSAITGYSKTNG